MIQFSPEKKVGFSYTETSAVKDEQLEDDDFYHVFDYKYSPTLLLNECEICLKDFKCVHADKLRVHLETEFGNFLSHVDGDKDEALIKQEVSNLEQFIRLLKCKNIPLEYKVNAIKLVRYRSTYSGCERQNLNIEFASFLLSMRSEDNAPVFTLALSRLLERKVKTVLRVEHQLSNSDKETIQRGAKFFFGFRSEGGDGDEDKAIALFLEKSASKLGNFFDYLNPSHVTDMVCMLYIEKKSTVQGDKSWCDSVEHWSGIDASMGKIEVQLNIVRTTLQSTQLIGSNKWDRVINFTSKEGRQSIKEKQHLAFVVEGPNKEKKLTVGDLLTIDLNSYPSSLVVPLIKCAVLNTSDPLLILHFVNQCIACSVLPFATYVDKQAFLETLKSILEPSQECVRDICVNFLPSETLRFIAPVITNKNALLLLLYKGKISGMYDGKCLLALLQRVEAVHQDNSEFIKLIGLLYTSKVVPSQYSEVNQFIGEMIQKRSLAFKKEEWGSLFSQIEDVWLTQDWSEWTLTLVKTLATGRDKTLTCDISALTPGRFRHCLAVTGKRDVSEAIDWLKSEFLPRSAFQIDSQHDPLNQRETADSIVTDWVASKRHDPELLKKQEVVERPCSFDLLKLSSSVSANKAASASINTLLFYSLSLRKRMIHAELEADFQKKYARCLQLAQSAASPKVRAFAIFYLSKHYQRVAPVEHELSKPAVVVELLKMSPDFYTKHGEEEKLFHGLKEMMLNGQLGLLREAFENGASANISVTLDGENTNLLEYAQGKQDYNIQELLILYGAHKSSRVQMSKNSLTRNQIAALRASKFGEIIKKIKSGHPDAIKMLVLHKFNVNAVCRYQEVKGRSVLHVACMCDNDEAIKQLLQLKANFGLQDASGYKPLVLAKRLGHQKVQKAVFSWISNALAHGQEYEIIDLINNGFDVNTTLLLPDGTETTLLHLACQTRFVDLVKFLIKHQAMKDIVDSKNKLPIDYANEQRTQSKDEIIKLLTEE